MGPVKTKRRKASVEPGHVLMATQAISSWNRCGRMKHPRKTCFPHHHCLPTWLYEINNMNKRNNHCHRFRLRYQQLLLTMRPVLASAQLSPTFQHNPWLSPPTTRWLIRAKQSCRQYIDALDGLSRTYTVSVNRQQTVNLHWTGRNR